MRVNFKTKNTKDFHPESLRMLTETGHVAHVTWMPGDVKTEPDDGFLASNIAIDRDMSDAPLSWLKDTIIDITAHDGDRTEVVTECILTGEKSGCIICRFEDL